MSSNAQLSRFLSHSTRNTSIATFSMDSNTQIASNSNFIKYYRKIFGIQIEVVCNMEKNLFTALFRKATEIYIPKEAQFSANSLKLLFHSISIEMRSQEFSEFLGILMKTKIFDRLKAECDDLYNF